jgi:small-conductance mechanosensitive channel
VPGDYLYDLFRELGFSEFAARTGQRVIQGPVAILLIVLGAAIVSRIGARVVRRSVQRLVARSVIRADNEARLTSRAETLAGVAESLVRVAVWTIAVMLVIDKLGVNPGPVLAGASIVGVAVGFGAQSLIKDFLSGFFVLAEDQYAVGDVITITDVTGTVEEVNLRVTRIRATDGTVWFVPNGEIRKVGNAAKDWSRAIVDVAIPSGTDVGLVSKAIADELSKAGPESEWGDDVLEPPEVLGLETVGTESYTIRVAARTQPAARARIARELRARIVARLMHEGVMPLRTATGAPPAAAKEAEQLSPE